MTDKTRPTITKAERRACFLEGAQDARYQAYEAEGAMPRNKSKMTR